MSQLYSIKCTNCAAPLSLLGGGRVQTITCSYCKSVLDLNDDYRILSNFKDVKEKYKIPFEIGMKGKIKGVEYTLIGRVTYKELEPPFDEWSELLLFCELYGYAWLTYEQGHLLFSRRNRKFPLLDWGSSYWAEEIVIDERTYKPFNHYDARILYVEGELTWVAKKGDKTSFVDFIAPPYGLSAEKSKSEVEYYDSEYLNQDEVYEAFGIEGEARGELSDEFHPLKPFSKPFCQSLATVAKWMMLLWFFIVIAFLYDGMGKKVATFKIENESNISREFKITSEAYLTRFDLLTSNAKTLNNITLQLYKEQKLVFSATSHKAYLFDEKNRAKVIETWEAKARKVSIYLNLKRGHYRLSVSKIDTNIIIPVYIEVYEKVVRVNYLLLFFGLLLFSFLLYWFFYWRYSRRLKQESEVYGFEEDASDYSYINGHIFSFIFWGILILIVIFGGD